MDQGYCLVSSLASFFAVLPKSLGNQPLALSLVDLLFVCFPGGPFRNRACSDWLGVFGNLGKSIDRGRSSERVVGSNLIVACRSSVIAGLMEYVCVFTDVGPSPPRAAMPSVADCDRGLRGAPGCESSRSQISSDNGDDSGSYYHLPACELGLVLCFDAHLGLIPRRPRQDARTSSQK